MVVSWVGGAVDDGEDIGVVSLVTGGSNGGVCVGFTIGIKINVEM